jgi:hypothetical protein
MKNKETADESRKRKDSTQYIVSNNNGDDDFTNMVGSFSSKNGNTYDESN